RRRLREGGGPRGMEGDVTFDLLHDLMNVAVEHCHRAKSLEIVERAGAVLGAPSPARIYRPQRDVGEYHDRSGSGTSLEVLFQPFELLAAEIAEAARLQVHDVDQADEVHAIGVERVPAGALGAAT